MLATLLLLRASANAAPERKHTVHVGVGLRGGTVQERSWLHWPVVCSYGEHVRDHLLVRVRAEVARRYAAIAGAGEVVACTHGENQCFMLEASVAALHAHLTSEERTSAMAVAVGLAYEQRLWSDSTALRVDGSLTSQRAERWTRGAGLTISLARRF